MSFVGCLTIIYACLQPRDSYLTEHFSKYFSGFTCDDGFLVKKREDWLALSQQNLPQIKELLHIEHKDLLIQSLAETAVLATVSLFIRMSSEKYSLPSDAALFSAAIA